MAVHKLTDQATLVDIVQNDANYWVRCAAFEHVTGQAAFADIAKNEKNYKPIRIAAIKKLDDRTILAGIAKNTADKDVCRAALNGFTDTEALIDVAENAVNWQIRADIYERLGYKQNALSVIAKHAASPSVRKAAVDDLTDQTLLVDIAKNADNWYARAAAVEKLTDRTALADIAENDGDWHVRVTAYTKLDDEQNVACLALIAKNHWNVYTRQEALKDIADMETLKDIAEKYIADINAANGEYNADISQKTEMVNAISQQFPELF
jgi:hypothetical protein